jgi:hypothetical protein
VPADTSLLRTVDMTGDNTVRIINDNVIVLDKVRKSYTIAYADIFLIVIMRRNSAAEDFSPALEEYMLITGSHNPDKFDEV